MADQNPDGQVVPSRQHPRQNNYLKVVEVVALGALGGIVANLTAFPINSLPSEIAQLCYSTLFCAFIGGIWTYVQIPEYSRIRAFQLGIVAPAVIVSLTYANTKPNDSGLLNPFAEARGRASTNIESMQYHYPVNFGNFGFHRVHFEEPRQSHVSSLPELPSIVFVQGGQESVEQDDSGGNNSWWKRLFG